MSGAVAGLGTWLVDRLPPALVGGVGAACRWGVDASVSRLSSRTAQEAAAGGQQRHRPGLRMPWISRMPWGMIAVNVIVCLLVGLLVGRTVDPPYSGTWAATALTILGTGFLGGHSTFSTACIEGARPLLAGRWGPALTYAILTTAATLGTVGLGLAAGAAPH